MTDETLRFTLTVRGPANLAADLFMGKLTTDEGVAIAERIIYDALRSAYWTSAAAANMIANDRPFEVSLVVDDERGNP